MPTTQGTQVPQHPAELRDAPVRAAHRAYGDLVAALKVHHVHLHSIYVDASTGVPMIDVGRISVEQADMIAKALGGSRG